MWFKDKFPVVSYLLGKKYLLTRTFFYRKDPVKWTKKTYKKKYGIELDLENPKTFYEKMNYWKHFSYLKEQDLLTDKIEVKNVLEKLGYKDICAKCFFETTSIKDFKEWVKANKDKYQRFVVKTSHSCGDVFIYDNGKITKKYGREIKNLSKVLRMIRIGLKYNHYYTCFEQNYKDLKPRVFVEEYLELNDGAVEYEFMCNYGKVSFINVVENRQSKSHREVLLDKDFNCIEQVSEPLRKNAVFKKPEQMKLIEEIISKTVSKFPFCRVDFIISNSKLYFCEFTFVKSGGINLYKPEHLNQSLGDLFRL